MQFERFFLDRALPLVRAQPGLVSVAVGRPPAAAHSEFVMITVWRDLDALKGFAGENWQEPRIEPDEADLLSGSVVHHYEQLAPQQHGPEQAS